jgi:valyl-tRNA synthetase
VSSFIDYDELEAMSLRVKDHEREREAHKRVVELLPEIVKEIARLRDKVRRRENKLKKLRCLLSESKTHARIQHQNEVIRGQGEYIERLKTENRRLRIARGFIQKDGAA